MLPPFRLWFWMADPSADSTEIFQWPRDSIYGAVVLQGAGTAMVAVMAITLIGYTVGPYTVSDTCYAMCVAIIIQLFIFEELNFQG